MLASLWAPYRAAKRRRGGFRQQLAEGGDGDAASASISRLAGKQMLRWSDGMLSAAGLQDLCLDELKDGGGHPTMAWRMGGLRANQNAQADLLKLITEETAALDHIRDMPAPGNFVRNILLPSDVVRMLHRFYPQEIRIRLGGDPARLREFWRQFRADLGGRDMMGQHPFLRGLSLPELAYVIPVMLHEDAGPISKSQSATIVSWSSLLASGSEKVSHYPIATFTRPKHKFDRELLSPCWDLTLRDFQSLALGLLGGEAIVPAEGGRCFKLVLLFCKGDEQVRSDEWGLAHHNAAGECCPDCKANRTNLPFTDLQPSAGWRATQAMSSAEFVGRMRAPHHPLVRSPFCWRIFIWITYIYWTAGELLQLSMAPFWTH